MALLSFNPKKRLDRLLSKLDTRQITDIVRKYDQNSWARWMKIANEEDGKVGVGVADPLASHAWINIAVNYIATNIGRVPFELLNGDTVVESGPVFKLFDDVNPFMSGFQLWEATASWLKCRGEAFWVFDLLLDSETNTMPQQIFLVDGACMKEVIDKRGNITMWKYKKPGARGEDVIPIMPSELIQFKYWNKWSAYRGVPAWQSMGHEISMDNQGDSSNLAMLANGSVPDGLLTTDQVLSKEQAKEVRLTWERNHKGAGKAHRISVLGDGVDYKSIALTPRDMEYLSMKQWNRQTILARLGVPGVLVGVTDEKSPLSGSDTKYQRKIFWNLTLMPDLKLIEDKLKTEFFGRFKIPLVGKFNTDEIPELQEDEAEQTERMLKEIGQGTMTINEMRELQDRDPVAWGDTWWIPFNMVPASSEPEPAPAKEPDLRDVTEIFPKEDKAFYSPFQKEMYWKAQVREWERIEKGYTVELKEFFFKERSHFLTVLAGKSVKAEPYLDDLEAEVINSQYWINETAELKKVSKVWYLQAVDASDRHIRRLLKDIGAEVKPNWTIYNTDALNFVDTRLSNITQEIIKTNATQMDVLIKDAIKNGWSEKDTAEAIRQQFGKVQNRASTIARTETGTVMSKAEFSAFIDLGYTHLEWNSSKDGDVRPSHLIDGETVEIVDNNGNYTNELFSCDVKFPRDPDGPAGEVINCRCTALPVPGEPE